MLKGFMWQAAEHGQLIHGLPGHRNLSAVKPFLVFFHHVDKYQKHSLPYHDSRACYGSHWIVPPYRASPWWIGCPPRFHTQMRGVSFDFDIESMFAMHLSSSQAVLNLGRVAYILMILFPELKWISTDLPCASWMSLTIDNMWRKLIKYSLEIND